MGKEGHCGHDDDIDCMFFVKKNNSNRVPAKPLQYMALNNPQIKIFSSFFL